MTIEQLKNECRWVLWRKVQREGKVTKPPFQPNGRPARNNEPQTWNTFAVCQDAFLKGGFDGVGMELGGGRLDRLGNALTMVTGIDGDACRDEDGKFSPEARELIIRLNSYAEYSPSDRGFHCWTLADLGDRKGIQKPYPGCKQVEVKGNGFYHTFTGRHLAKTPQEILSRQPEIDSLYAKLSAGTGGLRVSVPQDEKERFDALWAGDMTSCDGDHSRADFALCRLLARRYKNDILQMNEEFCKSALYREKWDQTYYASLTLLKAVLANQAGFENVPDLDEDAPPDYTVEPLPHREDGWFPSREVSLIGGSSGAGKTNFLVYVLTRLGGVIFGHESKEREYAFLLHDRGRAALRRTCRAAKLSASEVEHVMDRAIQLTKDQKKLSVARCLEAAIQSRPQVQIWVIEGLDIWLKNIHDSEEVGKELGEIVDVARAHNVTVIATVGSPKQKENDRYAVGRDQFMGSQVFGRMSETCINLRENLVDENVRDVVVMTRTTAKEFYWFTWDADGRMSLVVRPPVEAKAEVVSQDAASDRIEKNVFLKFKPGDQIKWEPSICPSSSFYVWRRRAIAAGKVFVSSRKFYRSQEQPTPSV